MAIENVDAFRKALNEWNPGATEDAATPKLSTYLQHAPTDTPERTALARSISRATGIPTGVVQTKPEQFEPAAQVNNDALSDLVQRYPAVENYLRNPEHAALSRDDIEGLGAWAQVWRPFTGEAVQFAGGAARGTGQVAEHATDDATDGLAYLLGGISKPLGQTLYKLFPNPDAAQWELQETNMWTPLTRLLQTVGGAVDEVGKEVNIPADRRTLAGDFSGAVGQMGAQIGTTLVNPVAGVVSFAGYAYGNKYNEAIAKGFDEDTAQMAGVASAVVEAVTEKAGVDYAIRAIPRATRKQLARLGLDLMATAANETGQEWLANIGQNLIDATILDTETDGLTKDEFLNSIELPGKEELLAGGAAGFWRRYSMG